MERSKLVNKCSKSRALTINYEHLEAELQKQIQEDELYWLQNDAKLRAVTQGTATYEDFRQIVLAAHLKPVSKEEKEELQKQAAAGKVVWNAAAETVASIAVPLSASLNGKDSATSNERKERGFKIPCMSSDLARTWKTFPNYEEKLHFLKFLIHVSGEHLPSHENSPLRRLCEEEVPTDIFPDCMQCLSHASENILALGDSSESKLQHLQDILQILKVFSDSRRFLINIGFLGRKETQSIQAMFGNIETAIKIHQEVDKDQDNGAKILSDLFNLLKARYFPQTTDTTSSLL